MSLTKLFNFKYFKENVKKSKSIILLMLIILPMFTVLQLMNYSAQVYDFELLSAINTVLSFVFPFLLSLSLFGYVYKKTSVDFMGSMPISRKTVFTTNTIGGAFLILLLQFITFIFTVIMAQFIKPIIFTKLAFHIFIYQTLSYLFVFSISNLAMSVSGNIMTQVAVTLLLFAAYPVLSFYINEVSCINVEYKNLYLDYNNMYNFTLPLSLIIKNGVPYTSSIVKTIILSIIYSLFGLLIFKNRKMEKAGESFMTEKAHLIVKGLTLIPFAIFTNEIFEYSNLSETLLLLAIILVYWFLYDLVTSKKIKIIKNLISLVISFSIVLGAVIIMIAVNEKVKSNFGIKDVDYLTITESRYYYNYYSYGRIYDSYEKSSYKVTDKKMIKQIFDLANDLANDPDKKISYDENNDNNDTDQIKVVYELRGYIHDYEYFEVNTTLLKSDIDKLLSETEKEEFELVSNAVCMHDYDSITQAERKQILDIVKTMEPSEIRTNRTYYSAQNEYITVIQYRNHKVETILYSLKENAELSDLVNSLKLKELKYRLENSKVEWISVDYKPSENKYSSYYNSYHAPNSTLEELKTYLEKFADSNEKIDYTKAMFILDINFKGYNSLSILSNDCESMSKIVKKDNENDYEIDYDKIYYEDAYDSIISTEETVTIID